jgi:hypothetical protein
VNAEIKLLTRLTVIEMPSGVDREQSDGYQGVKMMPNNDDLFQSLSEFIAKGAAAQEVERADKEIKEAVGQALPAMLPQLIEEAGNSLLKFLDQLFDLPLSARADSAKRSKFKILRRAVCELSTSGGNEFEVLFHNLSRAEDALDKGDEEKFRSRVRRAFDAALKAGMTGENFLALDQELKTQERRMELHRRIRRLIGSKGLRKIRRARQRCVLRERDMSSTDLKFYT